MGTLGFYAASPLPALADRRSYISKEQATKAIARLNNNEVYFLCEPCGEKVPELAIKSLSAGTVDYEDYWQYVFVDSEIEHNFINLAAIPKGTSYEVQVQSVIANCPAQIVSLLLPKGKLNRDSLDKVRDYHEKS